jgi:tryptophan-rich hypothetical protein
VDLNVTKISLKKLLNSKWTAVAPSHKEKHFMVIGLIAPELPTTVVSLVELEAVYTKRKYTLAWQVLADKALWVQGWV